MPFDFDSGNAILDLLPSTGDTVRASIGASDATIVVRFSAILSTAWFDAVAPYTATAVGIRSNLGRRPAAESATKRARNIALLYASYRVYSSILPEHTAQWRELVRSVGLDPDDDQVNATTPTGIGNAAGNAAVAAAVRDGTNQLGDEGGRRYNRQPYADYTGYQPVNTAYELRDPSRWQPNLMPRGNGTFMVQQFVTPQMGRVKAYTFTDPKKFLVPPPRDSNVHNRAGYKRQADEVLKASAGLTDTLKMEAEFFNNKFLSLGASVGVPTDGSVAALDRWIHFHTTVDIANFDSVIAIWYNKAVYDAVRPFSAIRYLYGDRPVTAWGGPGKGTVRDLPGRQWRSYLDTADHPEYPSGSSGLCASQSQAARRFQGNDTLAFSFTFRKGSSLVEPGLTPAADTRVGWPTWTAFEQACGLARLRGGVHFMGAIKAGWKLGPQFGDRAYVFVQKHIKGKG